MNTVFDPTPLAIDADPLEAFEEVLTQMQDKVESVVVAAYERILSAPLPRRLTFLERMVQSASPEMRQEAAILLGSTIAPESDAVLDAALCREGDDAVQRALHIARFALHAARAAAQWTLPEAPTYLVPPDAPLGEDGLMLLRARRQDLISRYRQEAADTFARLGERAEGMYDYRQAVDISRGLDASSAEEILAIVDGTSDRQRLTAAERALIIATPELWALPRFSLWTAARLRVASDYWQGLWGDEKFSGFYDRLPVESQDLRALDDACQASGVAIRSMLPHKEAALRGKPLWEALPAERIWPFFARHPLLVTRGLMLRALKRGVPMVASYRYQLETPMLAAAAHPWLQPEWLSPLLAMAFGKYRDNRVPARRLLDRQPMLSRSLGALLASPRTELRAKAAEWLKDLGEREMLPELRQALASETTDEVRARLLAALEHMGEDISAFLAKEVLLRDAEVGLAAMKPTNASWFPFDALPKCRWASGGDVDPTIAHWWVTLAWRLNDPRGNALLDRYLDLLTPASRSALGSFILKEFLAYDTRPPSEKTVLAYAEKELGEVIAFRQQFHKTTGPVITDEEKQKFLVGFMRKKRRECVGSAISAKGILALAAHAPGHELASRTRTFLRDYFRRLAQIEALLDLLAHSEARPALQVLLGVSHRFRKAQIQAKAGELIEAIAQRHNWTEQQLADRSVPTAGFDEKGEQVLDYGEREFTVSLDVALKPTLKNAEGKVLKALPEARAAEDPEQVKAAKAQFSSCKKEMKQVTDQQRVALREAMCAGRVWTVGEWHELVMEHPVLGRLAQQLIWQEVDANGAGRRHFRPGVDRSPIDTNDDVVMLDNAAVVRLAHGTLMSAAEAKAWAEHLWDYKVTPLFPQINRPAPPFDAANPPYEITNPLGGMTAPGILSGALEKLGYVRGGVGDGGWITEFIKDFPSARVLVMLGVEGIFVQGGFDGDAGLTSLSFARIGADAGADRRLRLEQVPSVLLAECYADFLVVAGACVPTRA